MMDRMKARFMARKVLRKLADEASQMIVQFTPDEFDRYIQEGHSLINSASKHIPQSKITGLVGKVVSFQALLAELDANTIIGEVEKRLGGDYTNVINKHRSWCVQEINKALSQVSQGAR